MATTVDGFSIFVDVPDEPDNFRGRFVAPTYARSQFNYPTADQPPQTGTLSGSVATSTTNQNINLTALGGTDWAAFGYNVNSASIERKATGGSLISALSQVGGGALLNFNGNAGTPRFNVTWTDGTPDASIANESYLVYNAAPPSGTGISFTVPAGRATKILTIYAALSLNSASTARAQLTATLSDGSAPQYNDTSVTKASTANLNAVYTIIFSAASDGQILTINLRNATALAQNVQIFAATLNTAEADPHFVGRFASASYPRWNFNAPSLDVPPQVDGVSFVGRYSSRVYARFQSNTPAVDIAAAPIVDTASGFIGRYAATAWQRTGFNSPATDVPQQVDGVSFLGRFSSPAYVKSPFNSPATADGPVPETNVEFRARFAAGSYPRWNFNAPALDVPPQIDGVGFLGRFVQQVTYSRAKFSGPAGDVPPQVDGVGFIGRYASRVYARFQFNTAALDVPAGAAVIDTAAGFSGRYSFSSYARGRFNSQAVDIPAAPVDPASAGFIGRYASTQVRRSVFNAQAVDVQAAVDTSAGFVGRFSLQAYARLGFSAPAVDIPIDASAGFFAKYASASYARARFGGDAYDVPIGPILDAAANYLGRYLAASYARPWFESWAEDSPFRPWSFARVVRFGGESRGLLLGAESRIGQFEAEQRTIPIAPEERLAQFDDESRTIFIAPDERPT